MSHGRTAIPRLPNNCAESLLRAGFYSVITGGLRGFCRTKARPRLGPSGASTSPESGIAVSIHAPSVSSENRKIWLTFFADVYILWCDFRKGCFSFFCFPSPLRSKFFACNLLCLSLGCVALPFARCGAGNSSFREPHRTAAPGSCKLGFPILVDCGVNSERPLGHSDAPPFNRSVSKIAVSTRIGFASTTRSLRSETACSE